MNAIRTYLETMFSSMPKTEAVFKAKDELLQMMEDKYAELTANGCSDNEAVGQVISEFGNLDDLKEALGLETSEYAEDGTEADDSVYMSLSDVESFITHTETFGRQILMGVIICTLGIMPLPVMALFAEAQWLPESIAIALGLALFFLSAAAGVMIFIRAGLSRNALTERLDKRTIRLDAYVKADVEEIRSEFMKDFSAHIAVGVVVTIIGVATLPIVAILSRDNQGYIGLGMAVFFIAIAAGLTQFIPYGILYSAYDRLLNRGEFKPKPRKANQFMKRIEDSYWLLVVLIYLVWSFLTMRWHITWIVFPIAGVLYALIESIVSRPES